MAVEKAIGVIEANIGKLPVEAIYIIDTGFKVLAFKGEIKGDIINYYKRFPLTRMNVGGMVHDKKSFLVKATERTGIIVVMKEEHHTMLAAAKLRDRINALSELYELDKMVEIIEKEGGR